MPDDMMAAMGANPAMMESAMGMMRNMDEASLTAMMLQSGMCKCVGPYTRVHASVSGVCVIADRTCMMRGVGNSVMDERGQFYAHVACCRAFDRAGD